MNTILQIDDIRGNTKCCGCTQKFIIDRELRKYCDNYLMCPFCCQSQDNYHEGCIEEICDTARTCYCHDCKIMFRPGCLHYLDSTTSWYNTKVITSFDYKGIRYKGIPCDDEDFYKTIDNCEWTCLCNVIDSCYSFGSHQCTIPCNYVPILNLVNNLKIFSNGDLPLYLILEILKEETTLSEWQLFKILKA